MRITCCPEKTVLVAVYAETPRKSLPLFQDALQRNRILETRSDKQNCRHHCYHHFHSDDIAKRDGGGKGYNRRAQLLEYARDLRASARRPPASSSSLPSHSTSQTKRVPAVQMISADTPSKRANSQACLGKWERLIPNFILLKIGLNSSKHKGNKKHKNNSSVSTTTNNMKAVAKSILQGQKKGSCFSKLFINVGRKRFDLHK
ncbi:uncharacterized protein LOC105155983 [Sesamum indicum]|uniref:Uncharacterized protein LOC105155983 n=1 Tax=Sesamum indicum TaxID=4182 RepID=A0A6I9SKP2_SESIN|nr:uncharacterized protein LOC105155983 [Sesamum indicum]